MVLMFLPDPIAALGECCRVLRTGSRVAIWTVSLKLRGTDAAPEPLARRSCFYQDEELAALARRAGLGGVVVTHEDRGRLLAATT